MEHVVGGLLQDFEAGKLTRRQLIQTLGLGVTAGPAALAAAQKPENPASRHRTVQRRGRLYG
jgi:hypothetical protein